MSKEKVTEDEVRETGAKSYGPLLGLSVLSQV